ncbi:unnamed protein product [Effrenium voratum]|nr:unnamed protein product [Effrenium voratum]|mmetsp:Transcript_9440/g.22282  ORF Transcript_9440/g.22282 Transcript_9440/m.22282 type:complete len:657 (+) Transcript_9440:81-2051(+)
MQTLLLALLTLVQSSKLHFDLAEANKKPTTKVVELLQGMQEQLESDAKTDEETYDKFKCWCDENTKSKALSVKEAEEQSKQLKERVEFLQAKSLRLKGEIEGAEDEVAKNKAALDTATALRAQQAKEFADDKQSLTGNIQAVGNALTTMKGASSFLQVPVVQAVTPVLQQLVTKNFDKMSAADRSTIQAFLQQRGDGDAVLGVLDALNDDFGAELKTLASDEDTHKKQYEELAAAKQEEIVAGEKQVESKKEEKAASEEERAHKKQEVKDLMAASGQDLEFAEEVKTRCAEMETQHAERSKTRADETAAVAKAIEILNADEAHENFAKTFAPSFLQESADVVQRRSSAAAAMAQAAQRDARLAALAVQVKIDNFVKVKKAIDEMSFALKKEQQDEVKQKDFCVESLQKNTVETEDKTRAKDALVAKEGTSTLEIEKLGKEAEALKASIEDLKKQMQLASQNREAENKEFQGLVKEQKESQRLLKEALGVLGKFYNEKGGAMIQVHKQTAADAPEGFKDYKTSGKSFGVMSLLQQLISDAEAMEAEATRGEQSSQKAYEKFATDTASSLKAKEEALADKKFEKAGTEKTHVQTKESREGVESELEGLATTKTQLHESCDWLMQNFDARQAAREEEIESIIKAKAILSGASFAELQLD